MAEPDNPNNIDIFRDTWIRYLGYANELGESFRAVVHVNLVRLSYVAAFGYVFADTYSKTRYSYRKTSENQSKKTVIYTALDTLTWQSFASVIIPGFTINRLCKYSGYLLKKTKMSSPAQKILVTSIGLCSIPIIIKPIDHAVDLVMDSTIRKFFKL